MRDLAIATPGRRRGRCKQRRDRDREAGARLRAPCAGRELPMGEIAGGQGEGSNNQANAMTPTRPQVSEISRSRPQCGRGRRAEAVLASSGESRKEKPPDGLGGGIDNSFRSN